MNETEWSALLFFKAEGHPINPETFKCTLVDLFLQDIGTPGYTAFKNDPETMMDLYERHPEYEDLRMGIIHSHHSMKTFYSGVDMSELYDNSNGIDFYLSIVVNNRPEWIARVVYQMQESPATVSWREDGELKEGKSVNPPRTLFKFMDLEMFVELSDTDLGNRVKELRSKNYTSWKEREDKKVIEEKEKPKIFSPAEKDFDDWKRRKSIPAHVDRRQAELFSGRTLADVFKEETNNMNFPDEELEEQITEMVDIAKACISLQLEEEREMPAIVAQINKQITEEETEIYIQEVLDKTEEFYGHHTGLEISESARASLYREIIALADDRNCPPLDALVKTLKKERKLLQQ